MVCVFFLRSLATIPNYSDLLLDPKTWEVVDAAECGEVALCLRPGDEVLSLGDLDLATYRSNWSTPLYGGSSPDGALAVVAQRSGRQFEITLHPSENEASSLFLLWGVPLLFWCVGVVVILLVRPRNLTWLLLTSLFQLTAVWIAAGTVSAYHIAGSMYVYHAIIWFFLPMLVHVHLLVPYPIFSAARRWIMPLLYSAALLLLLLDFTGRLSQRVAMVWVGVAVLTTFSLIAARLVLKSDAPQRMMDRILFFGVVIGLLPLACFAFVPMLEDAETREFVVEISQTLVALCLPIWPLSYLYALSKFSPGPIGLRANRLLGAYGFFCLFVTGYLSLYILGDYLLPGTQGRVSWSLALALAFVVVAPPLKRTFQKFVDRTIYGIKYLPDEIIGVFAARIPRAVDIGNLRKILLDEISPTLMIRESALFVWSEGRIEEVYREGVPEPPPSPSDAELQRWMEQDPKAGPRIPTPGWVRFAVLLQGRNRTLGVWLLGRRDPDDLYPASDRELLHSIANQIAPVVENIRLVERARREVEENRRLQRQLIQSQKMEAIGRLSAGVAHDFNNLLSVILGYSSLLAVKYKGDDTLISYLDDIRDAGDRAAELTRQLLAFSRQQVMEAKLVHLNHVVADVERMLQRLTGEDVEVRTRLSAKLPKVRIDPSQMGQVVMNLAVNARDAMPEGGVLELITECVQLAEELEDPIQGEIPAGEYVVLNVSDTGVGMAADQLHRIFEPYFTTKELGKGTGLGLSMVYGIVSQFQGHIRVASEVANGTRFSIYLPAQIGEESAVGLRAPLLRDAAVRGTETILVVEDEDSVRHVACEILQAQGYRVTSAADGAAALDACDELGGPPDLLLTDVVMPQMKGTDLAFHLKRKYPELRVLFMSGYNDEAVFSGWRGDKEDRPVLIAKPFSPAVLLSEIRRQLDRDRKGRAERYAS
ncbi:MAG: ATP-binding protein [Thermoanaerobaculia bacterium]|nr:ATP-binding protein [Thermoanaerobaculia bacterium]